MANTGPIWDGWTGGKNDLLRAEGQDWQPDAADVSALIAETVATQRGVQQVDVKLADLAGQVNPPLPPVPWYYMTSLAALIRLAEVRYGPRCDTYLLDGEERPAVVCEMRYGEAPRLRYGEEGITAVLSRNAIGPYAALYEISQLAVHLLSPGPDLGPTTIVMGIHFAREMCEAFGMPAPTISEKWREWVEQWVVLDKANPRRVAIVRSRHPRIQNWREDLEQYTHV